MCCIVGSAETGPVTQSLGHLTAPSCSLECCASCPPALMVVVEELVALERQEVPWETQVSARRVMTQLPAGLSSIASNLISLIEYYAMLCPELIHPPIQIWDRASLWAIVFSIQLHFAELHGAGVSSALMLQWHQM